MGIPWLLQPVRHLFKDRAKHLSEVVSVFSSQSVSASRKPSLGTLLEILSAAAAGYIILVASKSAALSYFGVFVRSSRSIRT